MTYGDFEQRALDQRSGRDLDYRYEVKAAKLPLVSRIAEPQEGDQGCTATGCIVVRRSGQWVYA